MVKNQLNTVLIFSLKIIETGTTPQKNIALPVRTWIPFITLSGKELGCSLSNFKFRIPIACFHERP